MTMLRTDVYVCPITKTKLEFVDYGTAVRRAGGSIEPRERRGPGTRAEAPKAVGRTDTVLSAGSTGAYPVVDGVPILLAPELLAPAQDTSAEPIDLNHPLYAEAYAEMEFYNGVANQEAENIRSSESFEIVDQAARATGEGAFPEPEGAWLDATYDSSAQRVAYRHLTPIAGRRVMQLGGKGIHAVKFLLAGAAETWNVTPMLGEALSAVALARAFGVEDRFHSVVATAEELPFADGSIDYVYSAGCLHHMLVAEAAAEVSRVLVARGRFAAIDPWRAPLYSLGTKVLGKREPGVHCVPLDSERVRELPLSFDYSSMSHHGAISRYGLLALQKFGVVPPPSAVRAILKADDTASSYIPGLRRYMGSSVACLAAK